MKRFDKIFLGVLSVILVISFFLDTFVIELVTPISITSPGLHFLFSYELLGVLIVSIFFYFYKKMKTIGIPLLVSAFVSTALSIIIKLIIAKPRFLVQAFYMFGIPNYSFPSSHAALAFAAVPILLYRSRKIGWVWLGYAVLVALSRVLFKQHYLSDIAAGALLGYGIGILVVYLINKKFK